jgi:hypothetical protein
MRIRFDIECTPEEARRFLGLPDVKPVHDEAMELVRQRMTEALAETDTQELMRTWLPAGIEGWTRLQELFWQQMRNAAGGAQAGGPRGGGEEEE